ncbi:MAG: hypothetical protein EPN60_01730 [Nevskiaceae bacterium]|nr:MAG: hypothetical protein EPO48_01320 [Nevskiaceae bacterium]TAM33314.1 MAG: hypothetical protein EPN60_01730 [Nevskiaceae bacterium]
MTRHPLAPLALLLSSLAACGGAQENGSEVDSKSAEASLLLNLTELGMAQAAMAPSSSSTSAKASETQPCESGELVATAGVEPSAGSPYTEQAFAVIGLQANQCTYHYSYADAQVQSSGELTLDGDSVAGTASDDGSDYAYAQIGAGAEAPMSLHALAQTLISSAERSASLSVDVLETAHLRFDRRAGAADSDQQWQGIQAGHYTLTSQQGSYSGSYSYYMGSATEPFTLHQDAAGLSLDGSLGYEIAQTRLPPECRSGALQVETPVPLTTSGDTDRPYVAGQLRLTNASAVVTTLNFNGDGSVTVSSNGQSQTYSYRVLRALAGDCVDALRTAVEARLASAT